jgi:hypothetical protein
MFAAQLAKPLYIQVSAVNKVGSGMHLSAHFITYSPISRSDGKLEPESDVNAACAEHGNV